MTHFGRRTHGKVTPRVEHQVLRPHLFANLTVPKVGLQTARSARTDAARNR